MKITARFSGVVSYSDGSHEQFAGHLDERGNLALNHQLESEQAVSQVQNGVAWLDNMLALLSGTVTLAPNPSPTPAAKTVTSMTAQVSGHIAYDDNTHGGFVVQYTPRIGAHTPSGGDPQNWTNAVANSNVLQKLNDLFKIVAGSGSSVSA